jgi:hypothetical protein
MSPIAVKALKKGKTPADETVSPVVLLSELDAAGALDLPVDTGPGATPNRMED